MRTISIQLKDEHFDYLESWAEIATISVEALVVQILRHEIDQPMDEKHDSSVG